MNADRQSLAKSLTSFDAESLKLRLILACLAGDDRIVPYEKHELADVLGVTIQTLRKRLKSAEIEEDAHGRIIAPTQLAQGEETILSRITYRSLDFNRRDDKSMGKDDEVEPWRTVLAHFVQRHVDQYGKKPWVDYRIAKNVVNKWLRQLDESDDPIAIIDAVFANYDTVWKRADFTSPSFGAMFGWLGNEARRYVEKRGPSTTDVKEWL